MGKARNALISLLWIVHFGDKIKNVESVVEFPFTKKMGFEAVSVLKHIADVSQWVQKDKSLIQNFSSGAFARTVVKVGYLHYIVMEQTDDDIVTIRVAYCDGKILSIYNWIQFFHNLANQWRL